MTYNENIRAIAEEMAIIKYPASHDRFINNPGAYKADWETIVNSFMGLAELCIEKQAEAYRIGYAEGYDHYRYGDASEETINTFLVGLGYTPKPLPTPEPENWKL